MTPDIFKLVLEERPIILKIGWLSTQKADMNCSSPACADATNPVKHWETMVQCTLDGTSNDVETELQHAIASHVRAQRLRGSSAKHSRNNTPNNTPSATPVKPIRRNNGGERRHKHGIVNDSLDNSHGRGFVGKRSKSAPP